MLQFDITLVQPQYISTVLNQCKPMGHVKRIKEAAIFKSKTLFTSTPEQIGNYSCHSMMQNYTYYFPGRVIAPKHLRSKVKSKEIAALPSPHSQQQPFWETRLAIKWRHGISVSSSLIGWIGDIPGHRLGESSLAQSSANFLAFSWRELFLCYTHKHHVSTGQD